MVDIVSANLPRLMYWITFQLLDLEQVPPFSAIFTGYWNNLAGVSRILGEQFFPSQPVYVMLVDVFLTAGQRLKSSEIFVGKGKKNGCGFPVGHNVAGRFWWRAIGGRIPSFTALSWQDFWPIKTSWYNTFWVGASWSSFLQHISNDSPAFEGWKWRSWRIGCGHRTLSGVKKSGPACIKNI